MRSMCALRPQDLNHTVVPLASRTLKADMPACATGPRALGSSTPWDESSADDTCKF